MPHLSKKKLSKKHFDQLVNELVRSFERAFKNGKTKTVFYGFFTYTERAMFAKRLAIIAMLSRGVSNYAIAETLHMSPSTIERMSLKYERGQYDAIIKYALGKKDIWEIIELILNVGGFMPPKVGGKRWRKFNKDSYDYRLMKT